MISAILNDFYLSLTVNTPVLPNLDAVTNGVFVSAKLVLVSGNCPFVDRNIFETGTGSLIC